MENIEVLSKWTEEISLQCDAHKNHSTDQRCVVFIMSDNADVIDHLTRVCATTPLLLAVTINCPILHIDRSPWNPDDDQSFHTYKRLFLEFLALHYMDVIIAVQSCWLLINLKYCSPLCGRSRLRNRA